MSNARRRIIVSSDDEDEYIVASPEPVNGDLSPSSTPPRDDQASPPATVSPRKRVFDEIADEEGNDSSPLNDEDESSSSSNEFFHDRVEYFQIPICDDDLLEMNDQTYYVRELASAEQIQESCQEFAKDMMNKHWTAIRHHFDNFFAACRWNAPESISWEDRSNVLELLQYGLETFVPVISKHVEDLCNSEFYTEKQIIESKRLRNYMLMYVYLTTRVATLIDGECTKRMKNATGSGGGAGAKGRKGTTDLNEDIVVKSWLDTRAPIVRDLYNLSMLTIVNNKGVECNRALAKLFQGGVYEQQLITTYMNFATRLLEGFEVCKASGRSWAFNIFYLIRGICMGFDRTGQMGCAIMESIKRIDAFQSGNTLTAFPFVDPIIAVSGKGNDLDELFLVMLNYAGRMDTDELKEASAKPYALLITSLAERHPSLLSKNLVGLTVFLNHDPPILRSAVLQAYTDMTFYLHEELKKELDERKKEILVKRREQMLQRLQCHICDDSAHVRSKVLNLWSKLAQKREIPLYFIQGSLISTIGSRLTDKSVMVRKAAAHALSLFLQYNCFGPNINLVAVHRHIESLKAERKELKKENPESASVQIAMKSFEEIRSELERCIHVSLEHLLASPTKSASTSGQENGKTDVTENGQHDEGDETEHSEGSEQLETSEVDVDVSEITLHNAQELKGLIEMVMDKKQRLVACDMFAKRYIQSHSDESYSLDDLEELEEEVLEDLQNEYIKTVVAAQLQDEELQLNEEERIADYKKKLEILEAKLENAKHCLMFAYEMQRCLPAAVKGIFTGQISEITESLNFISECRKFETRGSSAAVKDVLGLIWRKDNQVRDVVVGAGMSMFHSKNDDKAISNLRTTRNLMEIFMGNENSELESIEETVYQMLVTAKAFDDYSLRIFCMLVVIGNDRVRWAALRLVGVMTRGGSQYSRDILPFLVRCFESSAHPKTKELCLMAISNMKCRDIGKKKVILPVPFRLPAADVHIQAIVLDILKTFCVLEEERWVQRMRHTIDIVFHICSETSDTCGYMFNLCFMQTKKSLERMIAVQKELLRLRELQQDPVKNQKEIINFTPGENPTSPAEMQADSESSQPQQGDEDQTSQQDHDEEDADILQDEVESKDDTAVSDEVEAEAEPEHHAESDVELEAEPEINGNEHEQSDDEADMFGEDDDDTEAMREENVEVTAEQLKWIEVKINALLKKNEECKLRWKIEVIRLFWLVGEMALQLIVHAEETFLTQMKLYNDLMADMREKKIHIDNPRVDTTPFEELARWEVHLRERMGLFEPGDIEDDRLGVSAISVEDKLQQRVLFNMESRLFSNEYSILRASSALVIYVIDRRSRVDPDVVDAATFALGKIMLTSENLTKSYLGVFLECLPAVSAGCRNNMVMVLADLCYRFPNVIELNSDALFDLSEDEDDGVRETTMLVLSHLILNDQLKTRGTVAALTPRICDRHYNIAKIAKNFFTELSQKANILYNFLPDIISRLTVRMDAKHLRMFEEVMEFLLKFIIKEKQVDALFEKICHRFKHAETGTSKGRTLAACLVFCLAVLPLTPKSLCTINDNMTHIKPFLVSDRVVENFHKMFVNYKRAATAKSSEVKESIQELEDNIMKMAESVK